MPTYVVLTRLTPEAVKTPGELKRLERAVAEHVRRDCPQVKWIANYAHPRPVRLPGHLRGAGRDNGGPGRDDHSFLRARADGDVDGHAVGPIRDRAAHLRPSEAHRAHERLPKGKH